jgi:hypothetical protein
MKTSDPIEAVIPSRRRGICSAAANVYAKLLAQYLCGASILARERCRFIFRKLPAVLYLYEVRSSGRKPTMYSHPQQYRKPQECNAYSMAQANSGGADSSSLRSSE